MPVRLLTLCVAIATAAGLRGQSSGGDAGFAWLRSAPSAQSAALAGWQIDADVRDPALQSWNPAALNPETHGSLHFGQSFLPTGAGRSIAAAGYRLERGGGIDLGASVQYVGFGELAGRDAANNPTGDFNAREYAIGLAAAKHFDDRLHVGVQLQLIGGTIETYESLGGAITAGAYYTPDSAGQTVIGLQLQHLGFVWDDYAEVSDVAQAMPASVSLGLSRRLDYLPLRVGVLYRRLDRWDLLYDDPDRRNDQTLIGDGPVERGEAAELLDNFARHLAVNAEFYIGRAEVVQLRFGYDHQRQRESRVNDLRSLGGFSFGAGLNLRRLRIDFARSVQHLALGATYLGLVVDLTPGPRRA